MWLFRWTLIPAFGASPPHRLSTEVVSTFDTPDLVGQRHVRDRTAGIGIESPVPTGILIECPSHFPDPLITHGRRTVMVH